MTAADKAPSVGGSSKTKEAVPGRGRRTRKLSVRVDPNLLELAAQKLGVTKPADVINASLALAAKPDPFKVWLLETKDRLPDDFELAV